MADECEYCEIKCIHRDRIKAAEEKMPTEEMMAEIADLFKNFGDTTRIRILYALHTSELCVCDLSEKLNMKQPAISQQLKTLRQAKLVSCRREGKTVYYYLADDHVRTIIAQGREHIEE